MLFKFIKIISRLLLNILNSLSIFFYIKGLGLSFFFLGLIFKIKCH